MPPKSLADYYDGGYLRCGWHNVKVDSYRKFTATSGTDGVEFMLSGDGGAQTKATFWLTDESLKNSRYGLGGFAKACGLSREKAASYNPFATDSHRMLVDRHLQVEVIKDGDYHKADDWMPIDSETPLETKSPSPTAVEESGAVNEWREKQKVEPEPEEAQSESEPYSPF